MQFFGKTLIPQELEIMNAVKSGSIAMGSPAGAAATVFPEMGALLVPYLVKDYASAYAMLNGKIGDKISQADPGQLQAQGDVLFRLRLPAFLDRRRSRSSSRKTCAA